MNTSSQKFFLYARKSTDVEDKQVLSIDAQLTELREYAVRENIEISAEFVEKQSAKIPGRPIFNKMMKEIETFGGNILAWNPDRLARNSVDGGRVIYLLDTGKLASIKFPTFWCDSTSQGKFMLNMAFGQSKYYAKIASDNNLFEKKVVAKEIFGSHLFLGEKRLRAAEGGAPNSFGKSGKTAWAALCAAHSAVDSKPLSSILVGTLGLEPRTSSV